MEDFGAEAFKFIDFIIIQETQNISWLLSMTYMSAFLLLTLSNKTLQIKYICLRCCIKVTQQNLILFIFCRSFN